MHYVLTGGGTGGHIYPALAVSDALAALTPGVRFTYFGSPDRLEAQLVPAAGLPFVPLETEGLSAHPLRAARALAKFGLAYLEARKRLKADRPAAVLGTGGYVSAPVVAAAAGLGIPVVLQEQNAVPGKVNRALARFASAVAVAFPEAEAAFGGARTVLTGNPLRAADFGADPATVKAGLGLDPERPLLVVTGGSQGARRLNESVLAAWPALAGEGWQVLHVAGAANLAALAAPAGAAYRLEGYYEALPRAIAAADLVLCRAGAMTIAELTAAGAPSVLVPYPHAGAHQAENARSLVAQGAAVLLPDGELSAERVAEALRPLMRDAAARRAMADAARALGRPEAARAVAELLRAAAWASPSAPASASA